MFASSLLPTFAASGKRRHLAFLLPLLALLLGTPPAQAQGRLPAPELEGGIGFLGVDKPFKLKDLRGKIVLLDFWTLC